jgi:transmembrane sensor
MNPRTERTWQALGEMADHPVVAAWRDQARKTRAPRRAPWAIAAAILVLLIAGGTYRTWIEREPDVMATARGERNTINLDDGSRVTLNTSSRMRVDFNQQRRRVQLLEGEALFEVAKDAVRPFIVLAADREVVALGTSFGVRLDGSSVQVTLVEGRVAVDSVELEPGQQLVAEARRAPVVRVVDVTREISWQNGWIVLNRDTVREAIKEVSRYTDERIICDDARLAALHVSGTFRTGEVDAFLDALAEIHPLTVERPRPAELRLVWRE